MNGGGNYKNNNNKNQIYKDVTVDKQEMEQPARKMVTSKATERLRWKIK